MLLHDCYITSFSWLLSAATYFVLPSLSPDISALLSSILVDYFHLYCSSTLLLEPVSFQISLQRVWDMEIVCIWAQVDTASSL